MTPDELEQAGRLLFGDVWQTALARALRTTPRTVRRWAAGDAPIPGPAQVAIEMLVQAHQRNRGKARK